MTVRAMSLGGFRWPRPPMLTPLDDSPAAGCPTKVPDMTLPRALFSLLSLDCRVLVRPNTASTEIDNSWSPACHESHLPRLFSSVSHRCDTVLFRCRKWDSS